MGRQLLWGIPAVLYLIFVGWYTDFRGPLTTDEIEGFVANLKAQGFSGDRLTSVRKFMSEDTGRQFMMINIIDLADDPPDVPGAAPGESSEELMARYMEHMYRELLLRACHPILGGNAVHDAMDLAGMDGVDRPEHWTMGVVMRYRSRRSLMEVVSHPATLGRHEFKIAALEKTVAFPVETFLNLGDPRFSLGMTLLAGVLLADLVIFRRGGV